MTISELIAQLEAIKAEHGDLPVEVDRHGWVSIDGEPAFEVVTTPEAQGGETILCL